MESVKQKWRANRSEPADEREATEGKKCVGGACRAVLSLTAGQPSGATGGQRHGIVDRTNGLGQGHGPMPLHGPAQNGTRRAQLVGHCRETRRRVAEGQLEEGCRRRSYERWSKVDLDRIG